MWEGLVRGHLLGGGQCLDQNLGLLAASTMKPRVRLFLLNQTAKRGTCSLTSQPAPPDGPCLVGSALLATLSTGLYRPSEKCSLCLAAVVPDLGDQ